MTRLIDVEAINWYDDLFMKGENHSGVWVRYRDVEKLIRNAPTVDAVPVCRCKECKCGEKYNETMYQCSLPGRGGEWFEGDDFCSYGERKGGVVR